MEDKKIIYISLSNEKRNIGINKIVIEKELISKLVNIIDEKLIENGYIVFKSGNKPKVEDIIEESNKIKPDLHLCLHTYETKNRKDKNGPIIYVLNKNSISEAIAMKIFKQLKLIYYDPTYNRNIVYTENINELKNTNLPSIYMELFGYDNEKDNNWFMKNIENIGNSIFLGINNYFKSRD